MELFIENPGFQQIAETVFLYLNLEALLICTLVSKTFKALLDNPKFWLKKCGLNGLMKKEHPAWKEAIQLTTTTENNEEYQNFNLKFCLRQNLIHILKRHCKDIPCFINSNSMKILLRQETRYNFTNNTIFEYYENGIIRLMADQNQRSVNDPGVVQLIAPFTNNPNASGRFGITPIQRAAIYGFHNIIKALIPFVDFPNSPDPDGWTPIHSAVMSGYVEVIKALVPRMVEEDVNAPDPEGWTPIQTAALRGYTEIVKLLAPLCQDPNLSKNGFPTPMSLANINGHEDIISILKPFTM